MANPFDDIFRVLNWDAPDLTLAVACPLRNPFIGNIAATTAIVTDATGHVAHIQFYARDAYGNPETNGVRVSASCADQTVTTAISGGATCVITSNIKTALGNDVVVIPGTAGLVDLTVTFGGAPTGTSKFSIQNRHVIATKAVTIA